MRPADVHLDLEVFAGPFDLLLALVLREEVDLLELDLAEVVLAYLEELERRGELDLDQATEFLVLIAALLELKSRMMLPVADDEEPVIELDATEAAEELVDRMLEYRRYRSASDVLRVHHEQGSRFGYRHAPAPAFLRRVQFEQADAVYDPQRLGAAIGSLLRVPAPVDVSHIRPTVSVGRRLRTLRALLSRRGGFDFDEAVDGADRLTEAVTVFALLELYRRGEADWTQAEPFGPIAVEAT